MTSSIQRPEALLSIAFAVVFLSLLAGCGNEPLSDLEPLSITCYAATYAKGIYKTENGGESWFPLDPDQGPLQMYFKRIYADPRDSDALFVATSGAGIFRISNSSCLLALDERFEGTHVNALAFPGCADKKGGEVLLGAATQGVYRAADHAKGWQAFNEGLVYHDVNVLFPENEKVFAGTVKDLFRLDRSSNKWVSCSKGIRNKNITALGGEPGGQVLYAGAGAYGGEKGLFEKIPCLYKSSDHGVTWIASDKGIADGTIIYAVAVNAVSPQTVYLGTSEGIYLSHNRGSKWEKAKKGLPKDFKAFDIKIVRLPEGESRIYAAGSAGVFVALDDESPCWVKKSHGLAPSAVTSIVVVP